MKEDGACDQHSDKRTLCAEARFWPLMRKVAESGRTLLQQGTVARAGKENRVWPSISSAAIS